MQELLPIWIGVAAGAISSRIGSTRFRFAAVVVLSLTGGFLSVLLNGEWGLGVTAMLADTALVAGSAFAFVVILAALGRSRRRLAGNPHPFGQ
jgi:hypothetical protein